MKAEVIFEDKSGKLTMRNKFYDRVLNVQGKLGLNKLLVHLPNYPLLDIMCFGTDWIYEVAVTIDGHEYKMSGNPVNNAFTFKKHEVVELEDGLRIDLTAVPLPNIEAPDIELVVHYRIFHEHPYMVKWFTLTNHSAEILHIQRYVAEYLETPEYGESVHMFGELNVTPGPHHMMAYYGGPNTDVPILPGSSFTSERVYLFYTRHLPEEASIERRRFLRMMAPWMEHPLIDQHVPAWPDAKLRDYLRVIDEAAEVGIEIIVFFSTQFARLVDDEVLSKLGLKKSEASPERIDLSVGADDAFHDASVYKMFPHSDEDTKRIIEYAHKKGIKIGTYIAVIACGRDSDFYRKFAYQFELVTEDGVLLSPGGHGNMCWSGGWNDFYMKRLKHWLDLGFDLFEIDVGAGYACWSKKHGHSSPTEAAYANRKGNWEVHNYIRKANRRIYAPCGDRDLLNGMSEKTAGGYHEQDYETLSGMELVTRTRAHFYDNTYNYPTCALWGFIPFANYHRTSVENLPDVEVVYEHWLGTTFGYGMSGLINGHYLFNSAETKAVLKKWIQFYKNYREILERGYLIHVLRPSGDTIDAVMHVQPDKELPALLVVYNPTQEEISRTLQLPLHYANLKDKVIVKAATGETRTIVLEDNDIANLKVTMPPLGISYFEIVKCLSKTIP